MAGDVASCHAQPGRMALGCDVEGGWWWWWGSSKRAGGARVKKSRAWGLVGGVVHESPPPFPLRWLVFSARTL